MADAFISYAREDHDTAAELAKVFEAAGWDVWWDREILAGQTFDEVIERELAAAKVVVVLWSSHSIASQWVRTEATDALERGLLIPALLSQVTLPLAFRRAQTANLVTWNGELDHQGLEDLMTSVEARLGRRRRTAAAPPAVPPAASASTPAAPTPLTPPLPLPVVGDPAPATPTTTTPAAGAGTAVPAVPPTGIATGAGGGGTGGGGTGGGGVGLVHRLWGDPAAQRRTLIGGGAIVAVLIVIVSAFVMFDGGEPALGPVLATDQKTIAIMVRSGNKASRAVVVRNDGDEPAEGLSASVTGSRFTLDAAGCLETLAPGASCGLTVRLDATASVVPERFTGRLLVEGGAASVFVPLTGTVTGTRAFAVTPASLALGEVKAGQSAHIQVVNEGDTPLGVTFALDGAGFRLSNDCGRELATGGRCALTVTVEPAADSFRSTDRSGTVVVAVAGLPERRVAVSARLVDAGTGALLAAPPIADSARITGIMLPGTSVSYAVAFETTGFEAVVPGQHVHFFFDTVPPEQAGVPGNGAWYLYGGASPFVGYGPSDRPPNANRLCILVANEDHSVRAGTGNCVALP